LDEQTPILIDIQGLRKVFPSSNGEVIALDKIDLTIRKGNIFGIIGMSGAGKSTLIRCINRLEKPTSGQIKINGEDVLAASSLKLNQMRRSLGMIFQQFNLLMQATVEKNVRFPMEIAGMPRAQARARAQEMLELVGLTDKARAYPAQLSGGQKQRVAIARALSTQPDILLSDEATSALDPMTTHSILELLQDLHRRLGITIVLITHEMQVIRQICTHVAVIDQGRIAEQGPVKDLFTRPQTPAARKLFRLPIEEAPSDGRVMRLIFGEDAFPEPIIANMALQCGAAVSILSAEIRRVQGHSVGRMILRLPEDPVAAEAALNYLRQHQIEAQEVRPDDLDTDAP